MVYKLAWLSWLFITVAGPRNALTCHASSCPLPHGTTRLMCPGKSTCGGLCCWSGTAHVAYYHGIICQQCRPCCACSWQTGLAGWPGKLPLEASVISVLQSWLRLSSLTF